MSERRNWITQKELRMNAYYYSFSSTKCRAVDEILSAIACAGKAYHHTRDWDDDCDGTEPTYPDLIQEAADRAAKRIAELEAALTWQPIETAPKDNTPILVPTNAHSDGIVIVRWYTYNGLAAWRDWDEDVHFPTHWMPLPQPPGE